MPRNMDDGEDFEAEINAISDSSETDGSDGEDSGSDLDQVRTVLAVPGPDAQMHDVRKVGTILISLIFACDVV